MQAMTEPKKSNDKYGKTILEQQCKQSFTSGMGFVPNALGSSLAMKLR